MNDLIDDILNRPKRQKAALWALSIGLICVLFYSFIYGDILNKWEELSERRDSLEVQILNEKRIAKNLDKFRAEVKELDVKLKYALQELPDKREIPELLSSISGKARDAGLEVGLFKPKEENYREFYAEVPVQIEVSGSYHQVAAFFDEVSRIPRIVNINQIGIGNPEVSESGVKISANCVATTFRYLDETERKARAEEQGGDKRKRRS